MKAQAVGTIWTSNAKLFNGTTLIGYCLDTPNAIAKAMMEQESVTVAVSPSLSSRYTREDMASRMASWNQAQSNFQSVINQ